MKIYQNRGRLKAEPDPHPRFPRGMDPHPNSKVFFLDKFEDIGKQMGLTKLSKSI